MCKEKKAGDKMDHMRKEQPATKIIQFPRGTDVVSNLYCKRCGALVGMHTPLQESSKTADDGASAPREWCGCSGCMVHSGRRHGAHGRRAFPLFGNTFALAHGFTLDLDGVGVVDDPVTDGVGQGGVVQVLVPLAGVVLGAEDGGGHLAPGLY